MDFFKEYFDIWIFFIFKYDKCSSAGPKSYLLGMMSYICFLGRSSIWWNVTRWGFGSWKVPDPQWRPFPRREPNPRMLGPLPHSLHLSRAGQYDCNEPWGAAQGGKSHGHTRITPALILEINVDVYVFIHLDMCQPVLLSPETHAQLQGGVWGNGWGSCQPPSDCWWWGPTPNPCLPCFATNPLLQPE